MHKPLSMSPTLPYTMPLQPILLFSFSKVRSLPINPPLEHQLSTNKTQKAEPVSISSMANCQCFSFKKTKFKDSAPQDRILQNNNGSDEIKSLVRRFQWEKIERMTGNFSRVIGEGWFSTVYLGFLPSPSINNTVAVKVHRSSERLHRAFKQELEILMHVRHEHIVKLLGYCNDGEKGALVFELVSHGTLYDKLHSSHGDRLPWPQRMRIAYELARAIHHLHDSCKLQIVHCDITSSNVLLGSNHASKLCDFGSAKMGFSSTILPSTAAPFVGSPGYVDPHHLRTGITSKKNDVYSYGVLLLELVTGKKAFCEEKQQLLAAAMGAVRREPKRVVEIVDGGLRGEFDWEEAVAMAAISAACLEEQPGLRPTMGEVVRNIEEKIGSEYLVSKNSKMC